MSTFDMYLKFCHHLPVVINSELQSWRSLNKVPEIMGFSAAKSINTRTEQNDAVLHFPRSRVDGHGKIHKEESDSGARATPAD